MDGQYIIIAALAYLCGSIPFGYILVRIFRGQDIRTMGSGNIGATNVARTAPMLGILTLILDGLKGSAAVLITPILAQGINDVFFGNSGPDPALSFGLALACFMAVLGHMFPIWLRFKGGKGVATAVGALLWLSPSVVGVIFIVFAFFVSITRYVSLGSIVGAAAAPAVMYIMSPAFRAPNVIFVLSLLSIVIIAKHHQNIRRLMSGTENRFVLKRKVAASQLASED
jgi:acyl phosphate:glycerol-3-phosphate acyltransferase